MLYIQPMTKHVPPYEPRRTSQSRFIAARGLKHHVRAWTSAVAPSAEAPPIIMLHGWMDVGASFQFVVDALAGPERVIYAPDLRGFGLTETPPGDCYWFPDYLGDLDALLDALWPDGAVDLVGHSMGGNVVTQYAGVRPERVRRLVNLEGFGLPDTPATDAPDRLRQWLDELKTETTFRPYPSLSHVAKRLQLNNPRLDPSKAAWLAEHWAREEGGAYHLLGDPAHKRVNPILYRAQEALACFRRISAPVLWVEAAHTQVERFWQGRYSKQEFHQRLSAVRDVRREVLPDCGHMLHHDQPEALAALLGAFLSP